MNLRIQRAMRALPLVFALAASGAFANQSSSGANATAPSDSGLTAISPGRIVLFEYPNFSGARVTIDSGVARDLDWANFSNSSHHATSIKVESGTWRVCSEAAFQGECRVLGPGEYPELGGTLFTGVASAEPVVRPELGSAPATTVQ